MTKLYHYSKDFTWYLLTYINCLTEFWNQYHLLKWDWYDILSVFVLLIVSGNGIKYLIDGFAEYWKLFAK